MLINWLHNIFGAQKEKDPAVDLSDSGLFLIKDPTRVSVFYLEDAVPPEVPAEKDVEGVFPRYAWMRGGIEAPSKTDFYIVKFSNKDEFSILAYADSYQRVFQCSCPQLIPPAVWPSLEFDRQAEEGAVRLYGDSGTQCDVAGFRKDQGEYSLLGSWYDFETVGASFCLEEALSRAYLAFVYRPKIYGSKRPLRGVGIVDDMLKRHQVLESLNRIVSVVRAAESDPAQNPPAILRMFARMLQEAGLPSALAAERNAGYPQLRLVTPAQPGALRYLMAEGGCVLSERAIWQLESVLNHFSLVRDFLGSAVEKASLEQCQELIDAQISLVVNQAADAEVPNDLGAPVFAKDWDVRLGIGNSLETYRLPYRFAADFNNEPDTGSVSFKVVAPDAQMMNKRGLRDGRICELSEDERSTLSLEYALRVGVLLAATAFCQSQGVKSVSVATSYFFDQVEEEGELLRSENDFTVTFTREQFANREKYVLGVVQNPYELYREAGFRLGKEESSPWRIEELEFFDGRLGDSDHDAISIVDGLMAAKDRALRTDVLDQPMGLNSSIALGCRSTRNMRINYDAAQKHHARTVSEKLAQAQSLQEGVRILRQLQEETDDPKVFASCNRVMEQLTLGEIDMRSSAEVVSLFVGDDPYLDALSRSKLCSAHPESQIEEAIAILKSVIDEAEDAGVFADDDKMVYRVFDSSASRVTYNLSREGILRSSGLDLTEDRGKDVELAPDSYLFCNLELVRLLEHSFDRFEDALTYGHIALRLAPTMVVGYRSLARVYMLMGDMSSSRDLLCQALKFAVHPTELGLLYYQLGYVEWKAGRLRPAIACYLKAIAESPQIRVSVSGELRDLLGEEGARMMDASQVVPTLRSAHIPLAPNGEVLTCLTDAVEAAVNEGLYPAARNMLSLQLHHSPDNALEHVLRSLE